MQIKFSTAKIISMATEVVGVALIILFSLSVYTTSEEMSIATTHKLEMLKTAFALQQSSEDLTKFAGDYVITGDIKYKKLFLQVSNIRTGAVPRPTLLNSSYWYLPSALKTEHHKTKDPKSLGSIIESLPFTELELILIQKSHFESEQLELIEGKMFKLVESNQKEKAIDMYYSEDYHHSKVIIMTSLDKLYSSLNIRFKHEIEKLKAEQIHSLVRLFAIMFLISISKMILPTRFKISN